jgi:hypothetical protein
MSASEKHLTAAELAIAREIEVVQRHAALVWRGMEKTATIELVRSLDIAAVSQFLPSKDGAESARSESNRYIAVGAATALRPFLAVVKELRGGVPWGTSSVTAAQFADSYLVCCGQLAHLRRMAALERYGLATTSVSPAGHVNIETSWGTSEMATMNAMLAWHKSRVPDRGSSETLRRQRQIRLKRMRSYVDADKVFLIRYENDDEIVAHYRQEARTYGMRCFEGEAFPPDVQIGGRTFGEWKEACDQALGRILCHIDFAMLLCQKRRKTGALRNVLTIFARRDDVAAIWEDAGLSPNLVEPTMKALSLTVDDLDAWELAHEVATPFYVDLGPDFVLLPCFGAIKNPYFALFRHLRNTFKADWDRGVDRREAVFRSDIRHEFKEPRYFVASHGFTLRRSDGSVLTDIDAVVLDRVTGTLAMIQLKWHDVFGRSLAERESRRRNLREANKWVQRVHSWVSGRSSAVVLRALGIPSEGSARPPLLYVVARYSATFAGEGSQDPRAAWLSWPEILAALTNCKQEDLLGQMPDYVAAQRAGFATPSDHREEFRFRNLTVGLCVSSSI